MASQSRPEPMNASPHHSKVKVTLTLSDPVYVSGTHISGKMEIESRADLDSLLGIGVMMVELYAIQGRGPSTFAPRYSSSLKRSILEDTRQPLLLFIPAEYFKAQAFPLPTLSTPIMFPKLANCLFRHIILPPDMVRRRSFSAFPSPHLLRPRLISVPPASGTRCEQA